MIAAVRANPAIGWLSACVAVVLAFFALGIIANAISPSPSGPALSSYATTTNGVAAWAELLTRDGHVVRQLRNPIAQSDLPGHATLVVLTGPVTLAPAAMRALQRFLDRGGRLVLGGGAALLAPELHGAVIQASDPSFLENGALTRGDNAARALALAGSPSRPVYFDETVHGYGPATGLAALPERWWFAIVVLALALGAWALSRAVRLGGSDPVAPLPPSPRTAYIEAMAGTVVRSASADELTAAMRQAAEHESAFRMTR